MARLMEFHDTLAYWVVQRGAGELRPAQVAARPGFGRSLVRACFTGVSPGTERLVGLGLVPNACASKMACRSMEGTFSLPVKYGYSFAGEGIAGALSGRRVFVMHPHQGLAEIADADATELPEGLPLPRATLIPNLETALNAVWDAEITSAGRAVVFGAGPVGLLVAYVLAKQGIPAAVVDLDSGRRALARTLSWAGEVFAPEELADGAFTVAFHATGRPEGLARALDTVGFEGRVVDLSWYGSQPVTLDLGAGFHFDRKRIIGSQVGAVAPSRRDVWGKRERLAQVLELLEDSALDSMLGPPVPFGEMPRFMAALYRDHAHYPAPVIDHRIPPPQGPGMR